MWVYLGTIKGVKLNEPESDPSPICQKKERPKPGPNGLSVSAPSGPDGLYSEYIYAYTQIHIHYIFIYCFVFLLLKIIDLLYLVLLNLYKKHWKMEKWTLRFKSLGYLARLTLAFCPPLRVAPLSPITVRSPSGSSSMSFIQHRQNYSISTLQLSIQQILENASWFPKNIKQHKCFQY